MQTSGTTEVATEVATAQTQNPATQPEPPCNVIASTASSQGAELGPVEKPLPADSTLGGDITNGQTGYIQQPEMAHSARAQPQFGTLPQAQQVTPLKSLREAPAWIDCPFCEKRTLTKVTQEDSSATCLASLLCCLVCVCLVCVPSMTGMCANHVHNCSNCHNRVALRSHDGFVQTFGPTSATGTVPSKYSSPSKAI
ncbi:hypothetical protein QBC33DRAFT_548444 [Phialemonium atrogriseum]|uniref:LITAF domain-containing protein n=1 Tax=Phialemonium atrogriseum TaxID=1093897 RepID=A0AAJ0BU03_9PEZI|nr:uncharacterized protein QBC33DRAFT_548444 [Phialemonium atrogriseum]KAK1763967.1 hypothetical protein QBC33DRAFT_548444 [Phialemonium atrogriseum]